MRIIMMGTGGFAVPTFQALLESRHTVAALVTRPERPARGRRKPPVNPMRAVAATAGTPVFDPEPVNTPEAHLLIAQQQPELMVVCDYGQILKRSTLELASHGGINLHGSLLPKYRGAAPVQWALYRGETETGNTVIQMTPGLDAGPIWATCSMDIAANETAEELESRLAHLGAPLVLQAIDTIEAGSIQPRPQDDSQATLAPRIAKSDGHIDWTRSAAEIKNQVRAFEPWPKTSAQMPNAADDAPRLILRRVEVAAAAAVSDADRPGEIIEAGPRLRVVTGDGLLDLVEVQPPGKRAMTADEFLRGHALQPGQRFR